jgi:hypothetical protein
MPITIPNNALVFPTTTPARRKPGVAAAGMTNPGPVRVRATGASSAGNPLLERAVGRAGYYGYNLRPNVPAGSSSEDEALGTVSGCIIQGFAGVTPGAEVFVDPAAPPAPGSEGTYSGLTHTVPAGGLGEAIGVGVTPNKIDFYAQ